MKTMMLMRHGDYNSSHLSDQGKREVDFVSAVLVEEGLVPDVIVHSPVTRAVETAQRVQDMFNLKAGKLVPMVSNSALEVGDTSKADLLRSVNDNQNLVLAVTHQPNVESLSSSFGREVSPNTAEVNVFEDKTAQSWTTLNNLKLVRRFG